MKQPVKVYIFFVIIFLVGCAHQLKEPPRELITSKYFVKNEKTFKIMQFPKSAFPMKALEERQEGWCLAKFDISKDGVTENIKILDCSPEGYFEEICLRSTEGFRFDTAGQKVLAYTQSCTYKFK